MSCVANPAFMWCPSKQDMNKGACYYNSMNDTMILKTLNLDICSSKMNKANSQVREELKRHVCPYKSYCGGTDLITIVPTYDEKERVVKN